MFFVKPFWELLQLAHPNHVGQISVGNMEFQKRSWRLMWNSESLMENMMARDLLSQQSSACPPSVCIWIFRKSTDVVMRALASSTEIIKHLFKHSFGITHETFLLIQDKTWRFIFQCYAHFKPHHRGSGDKGRGSITAECYCCLQSVRYLLHRLHNGPVILAWS